MSTQDGSESAETSKIDQVAAALIEARTSGRPLDDLPDHLVPTDIAQAQRIDDRVAEVSGWEVLGWKIGCTSEHAQKVLGSSSPFVGRVYSVLESGAELGPADLMVDPSIEGEFAVTIGHDVKPGSAFDRAAVVAAVAEVRPAIEVVGGRFTKFIGLPVPWLAADAGTNSLVVLGPAAVGCNVEDLVRTAGSMTVDGEVTGHGTGADVLGDPINALMWFFDHLGQRGITLSEGQLVTTGTLTQLTTLQPGATAVAAFDGIGEVSVSRIE